MQDQLSFLISLPPLQCAPAQVLDPIQEAIMVVDAHPYVVNALAVCTATAEASAKVSAPMSDLMKRCLEEELPPACSPLPADSTFRALFNGEIRIHQGEPMLSICTPRQLSVTSKLQLRANLRPRGPVQWRDSHTPR